MPRHAMPRHATPPRCHSVPTPTTHPHSVPTPTTHPTITPRPEHSTPQRTASPPPTPAQSGPTEPPHRPPPTFVRPPPPLAPPLAPARTPQPEPEPELARRRGAGRHGARPYGLPLRSARSHPFAVKQPATHRHPAKPVREDTMPPEARRAPAPAQRPHFHQTMPPSPLLGTAASDPPNPEPRPRPRPPTPDDHQPPNTRPRRLSARSPTTRYRTPAPPPAPPAEPA